MIEKYESRRIRSEIRQVLLHVWDPIGVGHLPQCVDEYDCYLGEVYSLLVNGSNDEKIADYLFEMANDHMGLNIPKKSLSPTLDALRRISLHQDPKQQPS